MIKESNSIALAGLLVQLLTSSFLAAVNQTASKVWVDGDWWENEKKSLIDPRRVSS